MTAKPPPTGSSTQAPGRRRLAWALPLWVWLCHHPLLVLETVVLFALVWCQVGVRFGLPYLFWSEQPWEQFLAGLGTTLFLANLCYVGYRLDADAKWMQTPGGHRPFSWYLRVTWLPLVVVGLLLRALIPAGGGGSFARAFNAETYGAFLAKHVPFALGVATAAAVVLLVTALLSRPGVRDRTARLRGFFWFFGFLYLGLWLVPQAQEVVTPALALCLLFGLAADVYGFTAYHFPQAVYPVVALLVLVAVWCSGRPFKHRFPGLDYSRVQPVDTAFYQQRRREDCGLLPREVRDRWLQYYREHQAADPQERPRVVIVAVSGGGASAALWTGLALTELERRHPGFFYHIRLITGASGGMLGAAHFTSKLDALRQFDVENGFRESAPDSPSRRALLARRAKFLQGLRIEEGLEKGCLAPVVRAWAFRDVPGAFWPLPSAHDRGRALEEAWSRDLNGSLNRTVRSLRAGEWEGWRPSLVFSPTLVEDGRRLLISNLDLDPLTGARGSLWTRETGSREGLYSLSAVEFFRLFPDADEFRLSTAVRMNASFAYVSPVCALPMKPAYRVVDAAYYDNFGVNVAASWIHANREWIEKNTSGVVLLQIRNRVISEGRFASPLPDPIQSPPWWGRGLEGLTTPLAGAYDTLRTSMFFRNDQQLQVLSALLNRDRPGEDRFTTAIIECLVSAELNWSLSGTEIEAIRASVADEITDRIRQLLPNDPQSPEVVRRNRDHLEGIQQLLEPR
jgi:hypothetical protein